MTPDGAPSPHGAPDPARPRRSSRAADLSALLRAVGAVRAVPGGETLVRAGAAPAELHLLLSGRLAATRDAGEGASRIAAIHRPGALIGASAFLTGRPHDLDVVALRDCEVLCAPETGLWPRLRRSPALLAELARRALPPMMGAEPAAPRSSILGFVAVCDSIRMRALVEALAAAMREQGARAAVLGAEASDCAAADLSRLEDDNDFVLLAAERAETTFTAFCGRQIDRLVLVGGARSPLPEGPFRFAALAIRRHRLVDLVLVQPAGAVRPADSARWEAAAPAARLFHLREGSRADLNRLARVVRGRSVGLVLSGGGARAYAHVGVLRGLDELGVPVDFLAGTSMGGVIAAGVAMGWSVDELDARIQAAFVASSPLRDIAFPILSMARGGVVERRLREHFGEVEIADLWLPFTCASSNLTTGELTAHRSGRLRDALRTTISLPGVLPPVVAGGEVLVDGALVRNLPTELVRDQHDGPTIGVDVARLSGLTPDELRLTPPGLRWLTSGAWRRGPPIVSVLIRSATMPTAPALAGSRAALDVVIEPELGDVQLRDWKAFGPAAAEGRRAALARAEALLALLS